MSHPKPVSIWTVQRILVSTSMRVMNWAVRLKVTAKGKKAIVVKLLCGNEMGDYKDSVTLTLTDTKHLDITNENGTQTYHRCPRSKK
ncbi:MAG: hypothetical protein IPI79_04280 [Moraxellaceae bacterium]|nr:hypothetical protein [Moraxellaceae bacterium]